jgi:hypothetical protein
MPSPLPRQDRWNRFAHNCSIDVGLPQITVGSAPALPVSWPAQRSLALQPADSPSRLMRPSTPEAPAALLPPPPLRLLPGGAIQFPGGSFIPLWTNAFHGALRTPGYVNYPHSVLIKPVPIQMPLANYALTIDFSIARVARTCPRTCALREQCDGLILGMGALENGSTRSILLRQPTNSTQLVRTLAAHRAAGCAGFAERLFPLQAWCC